MYIEEVNMLLALFLGGLDNFWMSLKTGEIIMNCKAACAVVQGKALFKFIQLLTVRGLKQSRKSQWMLFFLWSKNKNH